MTASVFLLVLFAAALHAGWNAIVKGSDDKFVSAVAICIAASAIAAIALPFVPQPAPESWGFIGITIVLQTAYYALVAAAYGRSDMSQVYPVMRGGAPMIVALVAGTIFGEAMPVAGWGGIGLISIGILSMAALGRGGSRAGLAFAVMNAFVIAAYTLSDGLGVRRSDTALGYTLWVFLLTAPPVVGWAVWRRGPVLISQALRQWREGVIGGFGTMISYGVALWAMTQAPVAMVAALRETSILFATVISALILKEDVGWRRVVAVLIIACGAAVLRLA